jgi:hypothetical protein
MKVFNRDPDFRRLNQPVIFGSFRWVSGGAENAGY